MGLMLCIGALALAFVAAQRGLGLGMAVVLAAGYFYGLLRAVIFDGYTHFLFDATVLGLYAGYFLRPGALHPSPRQGAAFRWAAVLAGWPVVLFALCYCYPQHPLIQLVGLRATVWFLPFLLVGSAAGAADLTTITRALAVLNLAAFAVALGEYRLGLEVFLPRNPATELIYRANDLAGYSFHRIPSTFVSSSAYGGVMVASLPLLLGRWAMPGVRLGEKGLLSAALLAAAGGTFMCGSRGTVVMLMVLAAALLAHLRSRIGYLVGLAAAAALVAYFVAGNERLQRFTTLEDTEYVAGRIGGSVNMSVIDLALDYPLGAGLGSAFGTSIPSFLQDLACEQIGVENEFGRIALEQGLVGAALWLTFIGWALTRRYAAPAPAWSLTLLLTWFYVAMSWATGLFGCGLLTSIPGTCLLLFHMGLLMRFRATGAEAGPVAQRPAWDARLLPRPLNGSVGVRNGKA
jgi:hypothetical protein